MSGGGLDFSGTRAHSVRPVDASSARFAVRCRTESSMSWQCAPAADSASSVPLMKLDASSRPDACFTYIAFLPAAMRVASFRCVAVFGTTTAGRTAGALTDGSPIWNVVPTSLAPASLAASAPGTTRVPTPAPTPAVPAAPVVASKATVSAEETQASLHET